MLKSHLGRRVSLIAFFGALLLFRPATGQAAPTIASVVNGASFLNASLPNGKLAPGVLFTVFGTAMGPATIVHVGGFPLPTATGLGGTVVTATVGATTAPCIMIYSVATQVAAILPDNIPTGNGTMTVTFNGVASAPFPITVVGSSVGIFAINQAGSGPAVMTDPTTFVANSAITSASQGELLDIWTTGLGVPATGTSTDESKGPAPGNIGSLSVQAFVGTQQAQILYQGRSGCCAGEDQIRIMTPAVFGCAIPVTIVVNGVPSNSTTMSIAQSGATCSDPGGFSAADWSAAITNGGLRVANLTVERVFLHSPSLPQSRLDQLGATYTRVPLAALLANPGAALPGSCFVVQVPAPTPPAKTPLAAGVINASGPVGSHVVPQQSTGTYLLTFAPGLPPIPGFITDGTLVTAGNYTFNVTAGSDVGAHNAAINYPATFTWNEFSLVSAGSIHRSQPLTITWTGGQPVATVVIIGSSQISSGVGADFECYANATAGSFVVPTSVLGALPASFSSAGVPQGSLVVEQVMSGGHVTIPGIDEGSISGIDTYSVSGVAYQ